jgi:hypothetical protein
MGELRTRADEVFSQYNIYSGDGLLNHCLRLDRLCRLHADLAGLAYDPELVYLAAMLHDLGLMVDRTPRTSYMDRTALIARKETDGLGLDGDAAALLDQCMLYNHAFRVPRPLLPLAECFRRAVFTEHSVGRRRFGLAREDVRAVFMDLARANLARVLADFAYRTVVFEPLTLRSVFLPKE